MKGNLKLVGKEENGVIQTTIISKKRCKECGNNDRKNGSARCMECSNKYTIEQHEKYRISKQVGNANE